MLSAAPLGTWSLRLRLIGKSFVVRRQAPFHPREHSSNKRTGAGPFQRPGIPFMSIGKW